MYCILTQGTQTPKESCEDVSNFQFSQSLLFILSCQKRLESYIFLHRPQASFLSKVQERLCPPGTLPWLVLIYAVQSHSWHLHVTLTPHYSPQIWVLTYVFVSSKSCSMITCLVLSYLDGKHFKDRDNFFLFFSVPQTPMNTCIHLLSLYPLRALQSNFKAPEMVLGAPEERKLKDIYVVWTQSKWRGTDSTGIEKNAEDSGCP